MLEEPGWLTAVCHWQHWQQSRKKKWYKTAPKLTIPWEYLPVPSLQGDCDFWRYTWAASNSGLLAAGTGDVDAVRVREQLSLCAVLGSFRLEKPLKIIKSKQQPIVHMETFLHHLLLFVCITARAYALLAIFNLAVYQYTAKKVLCDLIHPCRENKGIRPLQHIFFYRPVAHLMLQMSWVWAEGCWWLQSVLLKQWTSCTWVLMQLLCWN